MPDHNESTAHELDPTDTMVMPDVANQLPNVAESVIVAAYKVAYPQAGNPQISSRTVADRTRSDISPGRVDHTDPGSGADVAQHEPIEIIVYDPPSPQAAQS